MVMGDEDVDKEGSRCGCGWVTEVGMGTANERRPFGWDSEN